MGRCLVPWDKHNKKRARVGSPKLGPRLEFHLPESKSSTAQCQVRYFCSVDWIWLSATKGPTPPLSMLVPRQKCING